VVVRVLPAQVSLLEYGKEVCQASGIGELTAVSFQECPNKVHEEMEDSETELKNFSAFPSTDILAMNLLCPSNASIG